MSVQPRPRAFIQFAGGKTKFKILTVVTVLLAVVTFTVLLLQQITETGNGVYIFLTKRLIHLRNNTTSYMIP